ncbi:MAG: hypothetical protein PHR77_12975 [Kiritimatiellae bacterium]|nr:hypothetical protein [Kiritimatiellia bacterium]MDD5519420.1 hypothetical protein [Kiritimatiellia bacterium]
MKIRQFKFVYIFFLYVLFVIGIESTYGWSGEHNGITAAAVKLLPSEDRNYIAPEASMLAKEYCEFPDQNWPCMGEWGGGNADPHLPRFPDTRREWDISFYCGWDPVLQKGKGYPHRPPETFTAVQHYFGKAVEALQAGRLSDGARFIGVMFHYIQDSGAFPHVQPIHRSFHTKSLDVIHVDGYVPHSLGRTKEEAAAALAERVRDLVDWTEKRLAPLLADAGVPIDEAKKLCAKELVHARVAGAVAKLHTEKPAEFESAACDCANECLRVCADALHTVLTLAPHPRPEPVPNAPDINLVFNPSFEEDDGDRVPDGWYVGWLDLGDRSGRAEWYRAGTHWDKPVKTGQRSVLLLWVPDKGLEWRQDWRHALHVNDGENYQGTVWIKTRAATGTTWFALQSCDTAYQPVDSAKSEIIKKDGDWQKLSVKLRVPKGACWLRVILHTEGNSGAVWFDDVEVVKTAE